MLYTLLLANLIFAKSVLKVSGWYSTQLMWFS